MPEPGTLVIAGLACWLGGCVCFLASGVAYLVHTIRRVRRRNST
ncbi:hypothetical protein [Streptomyces sp. NPDC127105]